MENTSLSNVADLSAEQRLAVETIVGKPLNVDDQLFVTVLHPNREPSAEAKSRARVRLEQVFAESDRRAETTSISDDEAGSIIDEAVHRVRSRAL